MASIEIPAIDVDLPIYHGTKEETLLKGVGHLENTSLPMGGESTHAVLSAHCGLPSARLFTDINLLHEGNIFRIHVLDETLTYQVYQIETVEPDDSSSLFIQEGKDLVTLITCTPYGLDIKVENGTWAETYDVLIGEIKKCTDVENRYAMMHLAEDMLMDTGCLVPLYFYTDLFMLDDSVNGFFSNPLGYKYFYKADVDGNTDSISVCIASEPDVLDPALNSAVDGATLDSHLFAGLAKWDQDESGKLVIVADCATELPEGVENEDGTVTYTYTLRDGLKWSDGQPVTAKDFEFAWKRAASEELGADYGYMLEVVKGYPNDLAVEATDDKTLVVTLNNSIAFWNELLAFPSYFPVREDVVANEAWCTDASTFVSNGAYKMTGWDHNSVITLTKNDNYWDAENVTMKEIKFYLSDDANNMLTNFKNGDWLLIDDVPTNEIATLKTEYPTEFKVVGQIGTYYVCWNINEDLLK